MTKERAIQDGLNILAGNVMPEGLIATSQEAVDERQQQLMVEWLNEHNDDPNSKYVCGIGTYYTLSKAMAKRMLAWT